MLAFNSWMFVMGLFDRFFPSKRDASEPRETRETAASVPTERETAPSATNGSAASRPLPADLETEALRLIDAGNAIEDEGRIADALQHYETAISLAPHLARAHLNRANALLAMGDTEGAIAAYSTALERKPDYGAAHYNLGNAYAKSSRSEAAVPHYRQALALQPDFVDAEVALGSAFDDLGRLEDAVASYRRALAVRPDYAQVHNNLALVQQKLGNLEAAAASYRRAIDLRPDDIDARNNLGNVLQDLGQLEAAAASYRELLAIRPDIVEAHSNLGNVLTQLGDLPGAIASLTHALELQPAVSTIHYNLGNALQASDRVHDAIESFRKAIRLDPSSVDAHCNLGSALSRIGLSNDAAASFKRALELKPDHYIAHNNAGIVFNELNRPEEAAASFREALRINPAFGIAHSNLLFCLNYRVDQSAEAMFAEATRFGEFAAKRATPHTRWPNAPEPGRSLRVGLVSGDMRNHAVGHFLDGALTALARATAGELELFGYPTHFVSDEVTERIRASCRGWCSAVRLSDEAFARRVREDRIDVLIDLSGHSEHNRLPMFAWKPAPVQATWLGYLATTGVPAIDYLIADEWTLPESEERFFVEKIWRLPESYICFTPPAAHASVTPLPALGNEGITFGSFNNLNKINDAVVALWARLLGAVPRSSLLIKGKQLSDAPVRKAMLDRFAVHGIDAQRLILMSHVPTGQHLYAFQRVDISLDPFPYQGITTTVESLYMGVPVLTLAGKAFIARQGLGLLTNAGLPEWIATDPDDFVARGVAHASDRNALAALRSGLRQRVLASPIFDAPRFANHFAAALRGMWQEWCRQQSARSI